MDLRHFVASGAFAFALASSAYSQTTITSRVATGNDDAEEEVATGTMDLGSSDLELINDQTFHLAQFVGIRFAGLNIPVGSVVTDAFVQFDVDLNDVGFDTPDADLRVRAEAADNAATFAGTVSEISTRPATTAAVDWIDIPMWLSTDAAGPNQKTPNIASVIQEVVSRPGWASGNSIVIIIDGTGERTADSFNGDGPAAPLLSVTLAPPAGAGESWSLYQ